MTVPAVYMLEAEGDIWASWGYYERKQAGLGDRFAVAIRNTVRLVSENPKGYGMLKLGIRAAPVRKFPFVVYYRDRGADVLIVAVQHGRRSSKRWRKRLT